MKFQSFDNIKQTKSDNIPKNNMELLSDVNMNVTVRIGQATLTIQEVMNLSEGAIVPLNKLESDFFDIMVNDVKFAEGLLVVVDGQLAIKVERIVKRGGL